MTDFIPYNRQWIDEDDINAVVEVLKSDWITQGPAIENFEKALADYCGAKYAVALSSGTSALHAAYFVSGIGLNDEIITSPVTFAATANAALYLGARPVFVDIEPDTGNINPEFVKKAITKRTKAVVPVHYGGHPVDLQAIYEIAEKHNLLVIEDACHAFGAKYKRQEAKDNRLRRPAEVGRQNKDKAWIKVGSCKHSDMTVFSFHPVKQITTGEGGAVLTNSREHFEKLLMFRSHGITKKGLKKVSDGGWYYEMQLLGYNYRITDIQASLGISQMKKLDSFIARVREIAGKYGEAFAGNPYFNIPVEKDYASSAYHLYPIRLNDKYKKKKKGIFNKLREKGLGVQVHYIPVYMHPYYQRLGYEEGLCPFAEDFYQREISIPIYPAMRDKDVRHVILKVKKCLEGLR